MPDFVGMIGQDLQDQMAATSGLCFAKLHKAAPGCLNRTRQQQQQQHKANLFDRQEYVKPILRLHFWSITMHAIQFVAFMMA